MQRIFRLLRLEGKTIGFVPTMGALHEGHLALVSESKRRCDATVVSIFVNPLQFGPGEEYETYPRDLRGDLRLLCDTGADFLFAPSAGEMFAPGYKTYAEVEGLSGILEGKSRPGHFRGVITVMVKLLNIVRPDILFVGRKDFQQAGILDRAIRDLNFDLRMAIIPTVRERDGLAASSRNRLLSPEARKEAIILHRALKKAQEMVDTGERSVARIKFEMERMLGNGRQVRLDYVSLANAKTLEEVDRVTAGTVASVAAWIGGVRLIDNFILRVRPRS